MTANGCMNSCGTNRMATYFKRPKEHRRYGERWRVETVFSMIKRRLGSTLNAHRHHAQNRAMLLKAIAHNTLIFLPP